MQSRAALLDRHRGQELDDVVQFIDLQLVKRLGAQRRDRDGHVLQILFALFAVTMMPPSSAASSSACCAIAGMATDIADDARSIAIDKQDLMGGFQIAQFAYSLNFIGLIDSIRSLHCNRIFG